MKFEEEAGDVTVALGLRLWTQTVNRHWQMLPSCLLSLLSLFPRDFISLSKQAQALHEAIIKPMMHQRLFFWLKFSLDTDKKCKMSQIYHFIYTI